MHHLRSLLRRHPSSTTLPAPPLIHFFSHQASPNDETKNISTNNTPQTQTDNDDDEIKNISGNNTKAQTSPTDKEAIRIQQILKLHITKPSNKVQTILSKCGISLHEELVLNVLKRHICDWKSTQTFFRFVCTGKGSKGYSPSLDFYNEVINIFGRSKKFDMVQEVLDEMLEKKVLVSNETWELVLHRYAGGHMVEEAIRWFWKREEMGLEVDLVSFQTLLKWLCRYKHVEEAEEIFYEARGRFEDDIKTWNIILGGWCVRNNLKEAKRFWKDILISKCRPDKYTLGVYINVLSKHGKITSALELFRTMWAKGCNPDIAICNTIIHGLCYKKRVPEALEVVKTMREKGYELNVVSYNTLIQHLCKIERFEKVAWVLDEMKQHKVEPNEKTYSFLLSAARNPEEVYEILEEMERKGCKLVIDTYNLLLRLFLAYGTVDRVESTWNEMEKSGVGHDERSYIVMVHGFYQKGRFEDALLYYHEMTSKGIVPGPRTKVMVDDMNEQMKQNPKSWGRYKPSKVRDKLKTVDKDLGANYS